MEAFVIPSPPSSTDLQQSQLQLSSIGVKSLAYIELRKLSVPSDVTALPKR